MRTRYQRGYLRLGHRKTRPACWEFLWWDNGGEHFALFMHSDQFLRELVVRMRPLVVGH
jgi:hypothetical protein